MSAHDPSKLTEHLSDSNEMIRLRRDVKRVSRENAWLCFTIGTALLAVLILAVSNWLDIEAMKAQQAEPAPPVEVPLHLNERVK